MTTWLDLASAVRSNEDELLRRLPNSPEECRSRLTSSLVNLRSGPRFPLPVFSGAEQRGVGP